MAHPYTKFVIPEGAKFELRPTPAKGWGVFATRDIKFDEIIFEEEPYFVIRKPRPRVNFRDVAVEVQKLSTFQRQQISYVIEGMGLANHSQPLLDAFNENSFATENETDWRFDISEGRNSHWGLVILHSRFNHSCSPSITVGGKIGRTVSVAMRHIKCGEELTFDYNPCVEMVHRTRAERRMQMDFQCHCTTCSLTGEAQQASDARRLLINGLIYLTSGNVARNDHYSTTKTVITDEALKRSAENFSIPISSRIVYTSLLVFLYWKEEQYGRYLECRDLRDRLGIISTFIQNKENMSIAATVAIIAEMDRSEMAPFKGFREACKLWGTCDKGDARLAQHIRQCKRQVCKCPPGGGWCFALPAGKYPLPTYK